MAELKTNYKNYTWTGKKKFRLTNNTDGTVSLEDATPYLQIGDTMNASVINETNSAINEANSAIESVDAKVESVSNLLAGSVKVVNHAVTVSFSNQAYKNQQFTPNAIEGFAPIAIVSYSIGIIGYMAVGYGISEAGTANLYLQTNDRTAKTGNVNCTARVLYVKNELVGGVS